MSCNQKKDLTPKQGCCEHSSFLRPSDKSDGPTREAIAAGREPRRSTRQNQKPRNRKSREGTEVPNLNAPRRHSGEGRNQRGREEERGYRERGATKGPPLSEGELKGVPPADADKAM